MLKEDPEIAQKMGAQKAAAHAAKKTSRPTKLKKVLKPGEFSKDEGSGKNHKQQQKEQKRKSKKAKERSGFFSNENGSAPSKKAAPTKPAGVSKGKKTFTKVQNKQKNKRMKK